jgi:hypothetical protein
MAAMWSTVQDSRSTVRIQHVFPFGKLMVLSRHLIATSFSGLNGRSDFKLKSDASTSYIC